MEICNCIYCLDDSRQYFCCKNKNCCMAMCNDCFKQFHKISKNVSWEVKCPNCRVVIDYQRYTLKDLIFDILFCKSEVLMIITSILSITIILTISAVLLRIKTLKNMVMYKLYPRKYKKPNSFIVEFKNFVISLIETMTSIQVEDIVFEDEL